MSTIPDVVKHAKDGMHKAVENAKKEFTGIRSGRASTHLLDLIRVEAYGNHVPINRSAWCRLQNRECSPCSRSISR